MKYFSFVILVSLFITGAAFGQSQKVSQSLECHKKLPARFNANPVKLAEALTKDLSDDSEKVCAIYSWVTHNISYDIHKVMVNDFKRVDVNKIIRKKKAICLGYADLFNALCRNAGLESVTVFGYIKHPGEDLEERLYFSTHAWNAVKINGTWCLFDATWDAGYIEWVRQTFKGKLMKILSFGKVQRYYFKPKFYSQPNSQYFFRNGEYFSYNHLSADPIWQLLKHTISSNSWSLDSAHFRGEGQSISKINEPEDFTDQDAYAKLSEEDQWIVSGFHAQKWNKRDYLDAANSYGMLGVKNLNEMIAENGDDEEQLNLVIRWHDTALLFYDSSLVMAKNQRAELSALRKKKFKTCNDHNKKMLQQCKADKSRIKRSVKAVIKVVNEIVKFEETSHEMYNATMKNSFKRAAWAAPGHGKEQKVPLIDAVIANNEDSLKAMKDRIYKLQKSIYKIWDDHAFMVRAVRENNQEDMDQILSRVHARMFQGLDDLDYIPGYLRDSMMQHKLMHDSVLFMNGSPLSDSLAMFFTSFTKQSKAIHKLYSRQVNLWMKKKSYTESNSDFIEDYNAFSNEYFAYRKEEYEWTKEWKKPILDVVDDLKYSMDLVGGEEMGWLLWEMKLEKVLDKGRGEDQKEYMKGVKKAIRENQKTVKKNQKTAVKMLKQLKQKTK
ncbi:MAG: hypothetical protein KG003_08790 [Bacteroidetes bacterium]|nr:hypothetical protein [Bacteroidota bacterium]